MTQTNANAIACPTCNGTATVALSGGVLLCLDCRNEWNPADVVALRSVSVPGVTDAGDDTAGGGSAHPAEPPAVSVATDPWLDAGGEVADVAADGWATLHELVGRQVVLEGGQVAEIVDFPDDDYVEVLVGIGGANLRTEIVPWDVIEREIDTPVPVADVDDDTARALGLVNLTVAALAIQAGLATIEGVGDAAELLTPPTGWLPADVDSLPILEQGVAYAIATLILTHRLDRSAVAHQAETFLAVVADNESTKGGTDDTDTSTDDRTDAGDER